MSLTKNKLLNIREQREARILPLLQKVRQEKKDPHQYLALCPVHGDGDPSLAVYFSDDGYVKFYCRSHNCKRADIINRLGLQPSDCCTVSDDYKPVYNVMDRIKYGIENKHGWRYVDRYDYCTISGEYLYSKIRAADKDGKKHILMYTIKGDDYELKKGSVTNTLYRIKECSEGVSGGKRVFYVEGEKDVETLRKHGLCATTAGGAGDWRPEFAKYFTGADLVILADYDEPGKKLAQQVKRDCTLYANSIVVCNTSTREHGDVTDYLKEEGHTIEDLLQLVDAQPVNYAPWVFIENKKQKINADILANNFAKGQDFLVCRNKEDNQQKFYFYNHGVYERINTPGFCSEIRKYFPLGRASVTGINNVMGLISMLDKNSSHVCEYDDLDDDDNYINLQNGLYSIVDKKLFPHDPKVRSTLQLNCKYDPQAKGETWQKFIHEFCSDDEGHYSEKKEKALAEFAGLILSNVNASKAKKVLWLYSQAGNTGKSVFMSTISYVLGGKSHSQTCNIPLQQLNENSKFSVGMIQDRRLIAIGDQSGAEITDTSILKAITGGDNVRTEQKHAQPLNIRFRGGIMIASNILPSISGGDKGAHVFDRFMIVPCCHHVSRKNADANLREKLESEADAVFMWALEGLHRIIENGYVRFSLDDSMQDALDDFRAKLDTFYLFMYECGYEVTKNPDDKILKTDLDEEYFKYCEENDLKAINRRSLKDRIVSEGIGFKAKGRFDESHRNNPYYFGIRKVEKKTEEEWTPAEWPDDEPKFD